MPSFSSAALDLIIRGTLDPNDVFSEVDTYELLATRDESRIDRYLTRYLGVASPAAARAVWVGGLIELAATCHYVQLPESQEREALRRMFGTFTRVLEEPATADGATSAPDLLELFRRLIARLESPPVKADALDRRRFDAFESYLGVTRQVVRDQKFHVFLEDMTGWQPNHDAAPLLAPRYFVEALMTNRIGLVRTLDISAAVDALQVLTQLGEVVNLLGHDDAGLATEFIAHAFWTEQVRLAVTRFDEWARQMADWEGSGFEKVALTRRVLNERLGLMLAFQEGIPRESNDARRGAARNDLIVGQVAVPDPYIGRATFQLVEDSLKEGRTETARYVACRICEQIYKRLMTAVRVDPEPENKATVVRDLASALVQACDELVKLGDLASAAAFIAPATAFIVGNEAHKAAVRIMAAARKYEPSRHEVQYPAQATPQATEQTKLVRWDEM